MSSIHYCAAWTECGRFFSCGHSHQSIGEAVVCIQSAGGYVVAVDAGTMRSLSTAEEAEFQINVRSLRPGDRPLLRTLSTLASTAIESRYAVMTRIRVGSHWTWTTWMCFGTHAEAAAHAREGDKVERFRSAEWQALRRQTTVVLPAIRVQTPTILPKSQGETMVEFVFRLLSTVEFDLELESKAQEEPINSEGCQQDETRNRKRA